MAVVDTVYGIRNINSQELFVLVERLEAENKMTIINPLGKVLTVPGGLFESAFSVSASDFQEKFTCAQIETIGKKIKKTSSRSTTSTTAVKRKRKSTIKDNRTGLGAQWSCSKLTFYKHKIDPLGTGQSFKIAIEEVGDFHISKLDFAKLFNDVVISQSYWEEGSFTYSEIPGKALPFITQS